MPLGGHRPTSLAGGEGGATCHWPELFPATPAPPSRCLACHQSFLLCVLEPVQDSRGSCGFGAHSLYQQGGAVALTLDAGHALLDANTPPFPGAHRDTPSPAAKQQEGRLVRVRTKPWNSRPVATQYSEHNWGRLCNCPAQKWGAAAALGVQGAVGQSQTPAWPPLGGSDGLSLTEGSVALLRDKSPSPWGPMEASVRQRGPCLRPQPHLAEPCERRATPKASRRGVPQLLRDAHRGLH